MNLIAKTLTAPALVGLLGLSVVLPAQAFIVSKGLEENNYVVSSFDDGEEMFELTAGSYTMSLLVQDFFEDGGASGFIITNTSAPEKWTVTLTESGLDQLTFTTAGGWFAWSVAGVVGTLSSYTAAIEEAAPVPLPPSVLMLGTAAAAMFSIRRRSKSEVTG